MSRLRSIRPFLRWGLALGLTGLAVGLLRLENPQAAEANGRNALAEIGVRAAIDQRGRDTPRGWGVVVGQVEGEANAYGPDRTKPEFRKIRFTMQSGEPQEGTGHATAAANSFYGFNGVALGVSDVHVYPSADWLGPGYLGMGTLLPPKPNDPVRVFSHSWIADPPEPTSLHALARLDYVADARHVHIVCGVGNGKGAVPYLLGSAYNVIAVGSMGGSSGNYTRIDTAGRCKPDIVGHSGATSFTTPKVAGVVACLVEQADRMTKTHPTAKRTDTIRAALMAGAIKPAGWQPEPGKPLDNFLGSGLVHYNRALKILEHPIPVAGEAVSAPGWGFFAIGRGRSVTQPIELKQDGELCLSLNWNRRVLGLWVNIPNPALASPDLPGSGESPSPSPAVTPETPPAADAATPQAFAPRVGLETTLVSDAVERASALTQGDAPITGEANTGEENVAPEKPKEPVPKFIRAWVPRPAICDLNLYLERQNGSVWEPVAESVSPVDNVEHLYFRSLPAGRYRAVVRFPDQPMNTPKGDGLPTLNPINGWHFALAWYIGPALQQDGKIRRGGPSNRPEPAAAQAEPPATSPAP